MDIQTLIEDQLIEARGKDREIKIAEYKEMVENESIMQSQAKLVNDQNWINSSKLLWEWKNNTPFQESGVSDEEVAQWGWNFTHELVVGKENQGMFGMLMQPRNVAQRLADFEDQDRAIRSAVFYMYNAWDANDPLRLSLDRMSNDANQGNSTSYVDHTDLQGHFTGSDSLRRAEQAGMDLLVSQDHDVFDTEHISNAEIMLQELTERRAQRNPQSVFDEGSMTSELHLMGDRLDKNPERFGLEQTEETMTYQLFNSLYETIRDARVPTHFATFAGKQDGMMTIGELVEFHANTPLGQIVVGGTTDAAQGLIDIGHDLEGVIPQEWRGYKLTYDFRTGKTEFIHPMDPRHRDIKIRLPEIAHSDSMGIELGRGIVHFLSIFALGGGMAGGFRGTLRVGRDVMAASMADASFDPTLGNLSTVLRDMDIVDDDSKVGVITAYLDSRVDEDATAEDRLRARLLKNAPEGAMLGLMIEPIIAGLRSIKNSGKAQQFKEWMKSGKDATLDSMRAWLPEAEEGAVTLRSSFGIPIGGRRTQTGKNKGQYVGAPEGIASPQLLASLTRRVKAAATEGQVGKYWYERSGETLLQVTMGNRVEAEKIAQLIGIFSSGTPVENNMHFALQAYYKHKAGLPVVAGQYPVAMGKKAKNVLDGIPWEGRKTNTFYNNLMRVIDPEREQGVTVDIWMMRAFGYKADSPGPAQYDFIENHINRLTDDLNKNLSPDEAPWEPHQVQAAIWVSTKANWPVKGHPKGIGLDRAKFDFSDAMGRMTSQISWESLPGATSKHLPEMFNAPMSQQVEYHVAMSKAFLDDDGNDIIAKRLGLLSPGDFEAPGFFESKVSPGTQTEVIAPRQYKGPKWGKVDESVESLINQYAAIRGILMKQDGVGWHRPFWKSTKQAQNGVQINIGRLFTDDETKALGDELAKLSGHGDYNPISTHGGVRLLHFDWLEGDNPQFHALVLQAFDNVRAKGFFKDVAKKDATLDRFAVQSGYPSNKWTDNADGLSYLENSFKGQPDIQREIRDIVKELLPRIDDIDADFAARYGWTVNEDILKGWRVASETGNDLAIGQTNPSRYSMGRAPSGDEYLDRSPADISRMPPDERVELLVNSLGSAKTGYPPAWKDQKELAFALLDDAQQSNWTKSDPGKAGPLADRFYAALTDVVGSKDPDFGDKALQSKILDWYKRNFADTVDLHSGISASEVSWDNLTEDHKWVALVNLAAEQIHRTTH